MALIRLLARHDIGFDDLAHRLIEAGPAELAEPGEVATLRASLADAERRLDFAEVTARRTRREARHAHRSAARLRVACAAIGGIAALLVALAWLPGRDHVDRATLPPVPFRLPAELKMPAPPAPAPPAAAQAPPKPAPKPPVRAGEHGRVLPPEGVLLHLDPVPGSPSVAVLPHGSEVGIDQVFPMLGTDWMQVSTAKGAGFVPADAIGRE